MHGMRQWISGLVVVVVATGGCAGGGAETPRGEPEAVVRSAPDRTFQHASAQVEAAAPDARSQGRISFQGPAFPLVAAGPGAAKGYPELTDPRTMVDLVRGAGSVVPYGGTAVRGVSTFRYETVIEVARALEHTPVERRDQLQALVARLGADAFFADVWVDGQGRLRRIQVPVRKTTRRPGPRQRGTPPLITVDLFDYEGR